MMKRAAPIPLWTKILLLAGLNLAILGGVFLAFLQLQLKPEFESYPMAAVRAKVTVLTAQVASDLQTEDRAQWDALLDRHSSENGVRLLLYRSTGEQLAGPKTILPASVEIRLPRARRGFALPPGDVGPQRRGQSRGEPPRSGDPGQRGDGPRDGRFDRGEPGPFRGDRGEPPRSGSRGEPPRGGGPPSQNLSVIVTPTAPNYWMVARMPAIPQEDQEMLTSYLVLSSPTFLLNPFFFEFRWWLGIAVAGVVISALCWLPLMRGLTHSIADMMRATGRIAEGRFDVEVKTGRRDELGRLGASIKRMADRLENLTEGRRRFLGAVAHELRSPIARMQLATEILERNSNPAGQKYLGYLKDDIETMSKLTDELLQLARAESAPGPVKVQPVNVAEAARAALRQEAFEGADIRIEVEPSVQALANMDYLVRSLANVLRNAVKYAGGQGPITVKTESANKQVRIIVRDSGPGVPDDALDKIFTPFYRVDDARDRRTGGTGLGLAIVRSCVEACGGKVECRNRKPSGLEVIILLQAP